MIQPIRNTCVAVTSLTVLALSACGGDQRGTQMGADAVTSKSNAVARVDHCALLTPEEVGEVLGSPPGKAELATAGQDTSCVYETSAPRMNNMLLRVSVHHVPGSQPTRDTYRNQEQQQRELFQFAESKQPYRPEYLDEPGIASVWRKDVFGLRWFETVVPGYQIRMADFGAGEDRFTKQNARILMEKAMARLPSGSR